MSKPDGGVALVSYQEAQRCFAYFHEPATGLLHQAGCETLRADSRVKGYCRMDSALRHGIKLCPKCMGKVMREAHVRALQQFVRDMKGAHIFLKGAKVYHRAGCSYLTGGTSKQWRDYDRLTAEEKADFHPCCRCHPDREELPFAAPGQAPRRISTPPTLPDEHIRRMNHAPFWAARGYQTFHRPDCPKLRGMERLHGFSSYGAATHAGYRPCRLCNPSRKDERKPQMFYGKTPDRVDTLANVNALCDSCGYEHQLQLHWYVVRTPVGRWRIDLRTEPYEMQHINLTMTADDASHYHPQKIVFRSVQEAVQYIRLHDLGLMRRCADASGERRRKGKRNKRMEASQ